jgi:hypothetical protein
MLNICRFFARQRRPLSSASLLLLLLLLVPLPAALLLALVLCRGRCRRHYFCSSPSS